MHINYKQQVNNEVALNKEIAQEALIEMDITLDLLTLAIREENKEHIDFFKNELEEIRAILFEVKYFR